MLKFVVFFLVPLILVSSSLLCLIMDNLYSIYSSDKQTSGYPAYSNYLNNTVRVVDVVANVSSIERSGNYSDVLTNTIGFLKNTSSISSKSNSPRHSSIEDIKRDLELLRNISKDRVIEALENDPTFKERVNGFKWELIWNDKAIGYVSRNGRIFAIVANVVVYDENDKPVVGLILWLELHSLRVISIEEVPWIIFFVSSHTRILAEENSTNNTSEG